ncbi:MAG: hypothetical protein AABY07_08065 [Nanoarchaeota archaeon]
MPLNDQDLKYVAKKLLLSPKLVEKLTESERDTDLILSQASVKNIKKQDSLKITALTYLKLVVYRYSFDTTFDIDDKLYIAKCLFYNYLNIKKGLDYQLITDKTGPSEKKSQYYLVLAGLYYEETAKEFFYPGYQMFIEDGFRTRPELYCLSKHIEEWVSILREINRKGWINPIGKRCLLNKNDPKLLLLKN